MNHSGVVFLDKPAGWSSRRAVNEVARLFSVGGKKRMKAGHAGTLDPLATGMLPIMLGEATRFADFGLSADKTYRFTMDLTYQTDTLDCEGDVTEQFRLSGPLQRADIEAVLVQFTGSIDQVPPAYSAIHVDGKRAHQLARSGQRPQLQARNVEILSLTLDDVELPTLTLTVHCSKGTYVRALARDIGEALHLGGCVTQLRRLSTGQWPESMMVNMESLQQQPEQYLLSMSQWLRHYPSVELSEAEARRFVEGQRIPLENLNVAEGQHLQVRCGSHFLGLSRCRRGLRSMVLQPDKVLPSAREHLNCRNEVLNA